MRHELTLEEQLEGVKAALRSRSTPEQLKNGLRRRAADLEEQLRRRSWFGSLSSGRQRSKPMVRTRLFISFDFDNDEDLRNLLVGQARHPDTPFDIVDRSLKEPLTGDWKEKFRSRLSNVDQMAVLCGEYTHLANGVAHEVRIAQEERKPYFLLHGRSGKYCSKPSTAHSTDKIYGWTWENLKTLIAGGR
jgi:hypothetical protein